MSSNLHGGEGPQKGRGGVYSNFLFCSFHLIFFFTGAPFLNLIFLNQLYFHLVMSWCISSHSQSHGCFPVKSPNYFITTGAPSKKSKYPLLTWLVQSKYWSSPLKAFYPELEVKKKKKSLNIIMKYKKCIIFITIIHDQYQFHYY